MSPIKNVLILSESNSPGILLVLIVVFEIIMGYVLLGRVILFTGIV